MTHAYIAGVVDSDGHIAIKRRRTPNGGWTYSPVVQIKQVETGAIALAHELFGGNLRLDPPAKPTRRPVHCWQITHRGATNVAGILLPYLRIKHQQAELIIQFGNAMKDHRLRRRAHWYKIRADEPTCTPDVAAYAKGISRASVYQAITNGSVPVIREGRTIRIPIGFWDSYTIEKGRHPLPPEYISLREDWWRRCKALNKVGPR